MTLRPHRTWLLAGALAACAGETRVADSVAVPAASGTVSASPASPACPATGLWSRCAIIERLDRSGLAPQVDSLTAVTEPPLTAPGFLVRVGRAELEIYLYPDAAAREREQAMLDRAKYRDYTAAMTMENQPTLIASANALAVLHSRNDHQRERVGDAITAGAPARTP